MNNYRLEAGIIIVERLVIDSFIIPFFSRSGCLFIPSHFTNIVAADRNSHPISCAIFFNKNLRFFQNKTTYSSGLKEESTLTPESVLYKWKGVENFVPVHKVPSKFGLMNFSNFEFFCFLIYLGSSSW